jgi:hypothetical protein
MTSKAQVTGKAGAVAQLQPELPLGIANVCVLDSGLVLPAASVALAFTVWEPATSATGWSKAQTPEAVAVVHPKSMPSTVTVTVLAGSAEPL